MRYRLLSWLCISVALVLTGCVPKSSPPAAPPLNGMNWQQAMTARLQEYGVYSRKQLTPYFAKAGLPYAPNQLAFLIFKNAKEFQIYGRNNDHESWRFVKQFRIYAASGGPGPKLKEGDRQVPEGVYSIVALNPRSRFDLSMQLNYPNNFDRQEASADHRTDLGGDIFIHGNKLSIGCVALGNDAIQQLFPLVYAVGEHKITVVIAPDDLRKQAPLPLTPQEKLKWLPSLYSHLEQELKQFPEAGSRFS